MSDMPFGICCRHGYRSILFPWVFTDGQAGWACDDCISNDMRTRNSIKAAAEKAANEGKKEKVT